ncbi:MAG: hypothetical protein J6B98_00870 [Bacilli bacterium]|nr:hypothetical protein [Bacilli bacterium]
MKIKFFCNLERVYITNDTLEERELFINEIIDLLENLDCNTIEFSFLSNTDINTLMFYINEFREILSKRNTNIDLGYHYTEDKVYKHGVIDNAFPGTLSQISLDVYQKDFDKIFYADKSSLALEMGKSTLEEMSPNSEVICLNCIDDGPSSLHSLKEALESYLGKSRQKIKVENK